MRPGVYPKRNHRGIPIGEPNYLRGTCTPEMDVTQPTEFLVYGDRRRLRLLPV